MPLFLSDIVHHTDPSFPSDIVHHMGPALKCPCMLYSPVITVLAINGPVSLKFDLQVFTELQQWIQQFIVEDSDKDVDLVSA